MKSNLIKAGIVFMMLLGASHVYAQDGIQSRSITSDDFDKQRAAPANTSQKAKRVTYKFVRKDKNPNGSKTAVKKPKHGKAKISDIGVTIWKLRPPLKTDAGVKLPVSIDSEIQYWTAERVGLDTQFVARDRVRLAVESTTAGYLYVINNEMNSDGSLGRPCLIFPESLEDSNSVAPGMLVDFPDQTESSPYFLINPKSSSYKGELLTIIITPNRLTNLKTVKDGGCEKVNIEESVSLDPDSEVEIFSRTDNMDKIFTKAESESTCGSKTRELEKVKSDEKPCGFKTRELTRDEPRPQSLLRVSTVAGKPVVAFIRLNVNH